MNKSDFMNQDMVKRIELKDKKLTNREAILNEKFKYQNLTFGTKGKFKGKELSKYRKIKEDSLKKKNKNNKKRSKN